MPAIKIHLEDEELAPVLRLAQQLHLTPEDVAYAALNQIMLRSTELEVQTDITLTRQWRSTDLPLWSDSAHSVHAYEAKPDEHSMPRR